jgi:tRNA(Ile2)-agmatinylcytidine synthase
MQTISYKNKRGLIGATAAIGGTLQQDHTFELLTYRKRKNWGRKRKIDIKSIQKMDKMLNDLTFNNIDKRGKPIITPQGPDPVLYGVRGETAETVFKAYKIIHSKEPIERYIIFRTNQGTDAHLNNLIMISQLKEYNPATIQGRIISTPKTIRGGHVILKLRDNSGEVECAIYEPTGKLRHVVWKLIEGDEIKVSGGVKIVDKRTTINVEKLEILSLVKKITFQNPLCSICGGRTESMGKEKGLRCKKCRKRDPNLKKETLIIPRKLERKIYLPDLNAQRHLTKPLKRYGKEKKYIQGIMFEHWQG